MAATRLSMRKLREVLRLHHEAKQSARAIGTSCVLSHTTVGAYLDKAAAAGLGWPLPEGLDDDEALERLLFPPLSSSHVPRPEPVWAQVVLELKRKHVTLELLWQEYREHHPDGYQYSTYCEHYSAWRSKLHPTMRQEHKAGEKVFVDFSGDGLRLAVPGAEPVIVKLFLAVLGASNFTYAEPVLSEELATWVGCHVRAFDFFEGVPEIAVPDNLKSGVTHPDYYEPDLNPTYADLAAHYGIAVIPARPRKPRDKAKVEQGVLLAERWILASLRNRIFSSLEEIREAVADRLRVLNDKVMRKVGKSRRQVFEEIERAALRPLPSTPYELAFWKKVRANIDYHVEFEYHFYSVHYLKVHELFDLRATERTIELFQRGKRHVTHVRSFEKHKATTLNEHRPKSHQAYLEWTPSRIVGWAEQVGPSTAALVAEVMKRFPHPQQGYRSCLGIIRLGKEYPNARIEAACARALKYRAISYKSVGAILKNGLDRQVEEGPEPAPLPRHENVRGPTYYH